MSLDRRNRGEILLKRQVSKLIKRHGAGSFFLPSSFDEQAGAKLDAAEKCLRRIPSIAANLRHPLPRFFEEFEQFRFRGGLLSGAHQLERHARELRDGLLEAQGLVPLDVPRIEQN